MEWFKRVGKSCVIAALFMMMIILTGAFANDTKAATAKVVKLKLEKTYTSYDITGDGQADKIRFYGKGSISDAYKTMYVAINNKSYKIPAKYGYFLDAYYKLVILKNGKVFVDVRGIIENDDDPYQSLYQFKGGKMVNVLKLYKPVEYYGFHINTEVTAVKGNTITVKQCMQVPKTGYIEFSYKYTYQNGKFKQDSNVANISNNMFTTKNLTVKKSQVWYANKECTKKNQKQLAQGTKAKAVQIYIKPKSYVIKIKTKSGATGWIKGNMEFDMKKVLFKEVFFAG